LDREYEQMARDEAELAAEMYERLEKQWDLGNEDATTDRNQQGGWGQ